MFDFSWKTQTLRPSCDINVATKQMEESRGVVPVLRIRQHSSILMCERRDSKTVIEDEDVLQNSQTSWVDETKVQHC
jgi:hypothetical protein